MDYRMMTISASSNDNIVDLISEKLNKQGHKIKWIGIELEEKWVSIGKSRIDNLNKE